MPWNRTICGLRLFSELTVITKENLLLCILIIRLRLIALFCVNLVQFTNECILLIDYLTRSIKTKSVESIPPLMLMTLLINVFLSFQVSCHWFDFANGITQTATSRFCVCIYVHLTHCCRSCTFFNWNRFEIGFLFDANVLLLMRLLNTDGCDT